MKSTILSGALDVDDKQFHLAIVNPATDEVSQFACGATASAVAKKLISRRYNLKRLRLCYEATYLGFDLCRELRKRGIRCDVIASSLVPTPKGKRVKTDTLDACHLATFYAKGLLTPVYIPDKDDEMVRDLLRSRHLLRQQLKGIKTHLVFLCRRMGLDYRRDTGKPRASYFTQSHHKWIEKHINQLPSDSPLKFNMAVLLSTYHNLQIQLAGYDAKTAEFARHPRYQRSVKALECFRGLDTLFALTLSTEICDIHRFPTAPHLPAWAGMAIEEHSSGGRERRFSITKLGNKFVRTVAVEACQYAFETPRISAHLAKRRQGADPRAINIADRCMHRLHKKAMRLLFKGKPRNKVKVACARELLCFVWEALHEAQRA